MNNSIILDYLRNHYEKNNQKLIHNFKSIEKYYKLPLLGVHNFGTLGFLGITFKIIFHYKYELHYAKKEVRKLFLPYILACLTFLPWVIAIIYQTGNRTNYNKEVSIKTLIDLFDVFSFNIPIFSVILIVLPLSYYVLKFHEFYKTKTLSSSDLNYIIWYSIFLSYLLIPFIISYFHLMGDSIFQNKYILPGYPMLLACTFHSINELYNSIFRNTTLSIFSSKVIKLNIRMIKQLFLIIVMTFLMLNSSINIYKNYYEYEGTGYKENFEHIALNQKKNDKLIIDSSLQSLNSYYSRLYNYPIDLVIIDDDYNYAIFVVSNLLNQSFRLWFLVAHRSNTISTDLLVWANLNGYVQSNFTDFREKTYLLHI